MALVDTWENKIAQVIGLGPEVALDPGVYGYRAVDGKWQYFYEEDFPIPFEIDDKARAYALFTAPAADTYAGDAELIDPDGDPRGTVYSDFYGHLEAGGVAQVFSDLVTIDKKGTWKVHFVIRLPETEEVLVEGTWDAIAVEVLPPPPPKPFPWHWLGIGAGTLGLILLAKPKKKT